jgi:hypothetical protein
MKPSIKWIFIFIIFNGYIVDINCQNKWWQREIPTPSANQMINPDYISKRRELEINLDELNGVKERHGQQKLTREQQMQYDYILFLYDSKITRLEEELKVLPMYIDNPKFNNQNIYFQNNNQQRTDVNISSPSISTSNVKSLDNNYLLALYRIKNCDKKNYKSDYEFNKESLNLYYNLKANIDEIVSSETDLRPNSGGFSFYKEKIKYYGIFINNWGPSIGSNEAEKEINNINKMIEEVTKSNEKYFNKTHTDIILHYNIIGGFLPEKEVKKSTAFRYWYEYYNYYLEIIGYDNPGDLKFKNGNKKEYFYSYQNSGFDPIKFYNEGGYKNIKFECFTYTDEPGKENKIIKEFSVEIPFTLGKKTILNLDFYLESTYMKDIRYKIEQVDELPNGINFDN